MSDFIDPTIRNKNMFAFKNFPNTNAFFMVKLRKLFRVKNKVILVEDLSCCQGGGFRDFLFSTLLGEMIQFD